MFNKISSWHIKNFRILGDVKIDFTKSPIITLVGENEAGKTSVVKSFAVLGANAYATEQKSFIRDGTNGFGISAQLEDGTQITRVQTPTKKEIQISKDGNIVYSADKIDRGYGVPVEIEKVMGMIVEPETKELLQVRTYEDQLLFVLTKNSENYKVMYNALKVDSITKAIKAGNAQATQDRTDIAKFESSIETLEDELKSIKTVDITNAVRVRDAIKQSLSLIQKLSKLASAMESKESLERQLGAYKDIVNLSEINQIVASTLNKLNDAHNDACAYMTRYGKYSELGNIGEIETGAIEKLSKVCDSIVSAQDIRSKYEMYRKVSELSEINTGSLDKIHKLCDSIDNIKDDVEKSQRMESAISRLTDINTDVYDRLNSLMDNVNQFNEHSNNISAFKSEADRYYSLIKETGAIVTECPNCGETVVVDPSIV